MWPWGACWLQEGWQTADLDAHKKRLMCGLGEKPLMYGPGVPVGCKRAGKRQTWMPIRSHWCVALGWRLAAGWSMPSQRFKGFTVFKGLEGFKRLEGLERLEGFKGLRAGKRQTWTHIRSQWCVAVGCLLAARVAIRSHWCVARGGCWLQDEACEVNVLRVRVLRFLRVWRVLSVWRVWRVRRVGF